MAIKVKVMASQVVQEARETGKTKEIGRVKETKGIGRVKEIGRAKITGRVKADGRTKITGKAKNRITQVQRGKAARGKSPKERKASRYLQLQ